MEPKELELVTEKSVAALLGVSRRMIRKYLILHGLRCVGTGRSRRFVWLDVLEWYLLYRVEIVGNGGNQRETLAEKLRQIRNQAAASA